MNVDDNNPNSAKARGSRLRYIREELLGLSRNKFAERHKEKKLTINNLQNMEDARFKGMKVEHVELLLPALEEEGIICSKAWLLEGTGDPPRFRNYLEHFTGENVASKKNNELIGQEKLEDTAIAAELRAFREGHVDAVDAIISDDALEPCFLTGDYVAGIRYTGVDINQAIGLPCIVQTQTGQVLTRILANGKAEGCYTLAGSKYATKDYTLSEVKVFSAAPIVWWRRPLKLSSFKR
ncbi:MAG: hypothetical protein K0S11_1611 [Gammaproteobacteria bacterium]|jgi:hypothetical protein|nr:hypothetical protein [Gammaproteobacteria bacterium]